MDLYDLFGIGGIGCRDAKFYVHTNHEQKRGNFMLSLRYKKDSE